MSINNPSPSVPPLTQTERWAATQRADRAAALEHWMASQPADQTGEEYIAARESMELYY